MAISRDCRSGSSEFNSGAERGMTDMVDQFAFDVFLSYSSKDKGTVRGIACLGVLSAL